MSFASPRFTHILNEAPAAEQEHETSASLDGLVASALSDTVASRIDDVPAGSEPLEPQQTILGPLSCYSLGGGKAYFFRGTQYARVDNIYVGLAGDSLAAGPFTIPRTWPSLAQAGFTTIDAVLPMRHGSAFFFSGSEYARVDNIRLGCGSDTLGSGPATIARTWPSLAQADFTTIDAVLPVGSESAYFFSGSQYARIDNIRVGYGVDILGAGPWNIAESWPSLAQAGFYDVDAVLPMGGGSAYFFCGNQYARIDNIWLGSGGDTVGCGPAEVRDDWNSLRQASFW